MQFRFAAVLVVGLLFTSSVDAWGHKGKGKEHEAGDETSPTTSEPSTTGASNTDQTTITSNGPSDSSSTPSGSSSAPVSADTSGTSGTGGTTQASGSSVVPGGSSVAPGGSTAAPGTTGTPASTTPAPLPDVTVSVLQFSDPSCDSSVCTFTFNAPGNDQAFLATESAVIADDRSQYSSLQTAANAKDTNIKKANDDAQQKIKDLQSLLDGIQMNLATIQSNIQTIQANQIEAQSTLQFVQKFIANVNTSPDNCLYQRCLKPTTPAPPTTTPTPSPTTPPSPCLNFSCPDDTDTDKFCLLDSFNKPYCTNCLNNFDGYGQCKTIACNAGGSGFVLDSENTGTLYSTGYNATNPGSSLVPANADCVWQLNGTGTFQVNAAGFNLSCLASDNVEMVLSFASGNSLPLYSSTLVRSINAVLSKSTNPIFTLTSTAADASFCSIPLTYTEPTPTPPAGVFEKKPNGFFSWLMGN